MSYERMWSPHRVERLCDTDVLESGTLPCGARISILNRVTGFAWGARDTETGLRDTNGNFWLASGNFDIRDYLHRCETEDDVMAMIRNNANTCVNSAPRFGYDAQERFPAEGWAP